MTNDEIRTIYINKLETPQTIYLGVGGPQMRCAECDNNLIAGWLSSTSYSNDFWSILIRPVEGGFFRAMWLCQEHLEAYLNGKVYKEE